MFHTRIHFINSICAKINIEWSQLNSILNKNKWKNKRKKYLKKKNTGPNEKDVQQRNKTHTKNTEYNVHKGIEMRNDFNVKNLKRERERERVWKMWVEFEMWMKCNFKFYSTNVQKFCRKMFNCYLNFSPSFQLDYKRWQFAHFRESYIELCLWHVT